MKMAKKLTKFSGTEQKLPGTATVTSGANLPAPTVLPAGPVQSGKPDPQLTPTSAGIGAATASVPAQADAPLIAHFPQSVESGLPVLERTREFVSLQVMRLQEENADEMRVVIKPEAGLQLSLHLQQRGGGVEVEATLNHGNFELLSRHWPELQQQLESRGVRLAPLADSKTSFGGGSEGFRQPTTSHGQQNRDGVDPAETPATLLPGLPTATATASASGMPSTRLETWA